jgi:hypothetical protein
MRVLLPFFVTATFALTLGAPAQDRSTHEHGGQSTIDGATINGSTGDGQRGNGHAENHDWYKELRQPGTGYSCCNGTVNGIDGDCRPTRAYQTEDGIWRALVNGRWQPVPPRTVLQRLAPDGNSHICAGKSGMIYCFIGGSPKS